jgi:hypothetical protein
MAAASDMTDEAKMAARAARFKATSEPESASKDPVRTPARPKMAHPESITIVDLKGTQLRFWRRKIASGAGLNAAAQRQLEAAFGAGSYAKAMDAKSIDVVLPQKKCAASSESSESTAVAQVLADSSTDDGPIPEPTASTSDATQAPSSKTTGSAHEASEVPK